MEAKGDMFGGGATERGGLAQSSDKQYNSSAPNGVTTTESNLQNLILSCRAALAEYNKLYFEFEVVASKSDIDKQGQARVKVAAGVLSKQALKLSRFCIDKLTSLSLACMDEASAVFFECKWEREFAKDPCPKMSFSGRQLSGEWNILCFLQHLSLLFRKFLKRKAKA